MSPLRVALDATPVISGRTGISLYVSELAAALARQHVEPRLFAVGRGVAPAPPGCRHLRVPARLVHRSWALGGPPRAEQLVGPVDVVHATGMLPPTTRRPLVATVHDLASIDHPELHHARLVRQITSLLRRLDRVDVVLADSRATRDALERHGVAGERIVVAHPGLTALPDAPPRRVVDGPFFLAVGEQMPRKGLRMLLDAFAAARVDDALLVHAGPPSTATADLLAHTRALGLDQRVRWLGYVTREQLSALLRDAIALCFPSVDEGFGLPVLEAMSCGTPVIASDIPPLREVAGDEALFVPTGDVEAWSHALEVLVRDDELQRRLRAGGRARALEFTWDACASTTIAAYERARAAFS